MRLEWITNTHEEHGIHVWLLEEPLQLVRSHACLLGKPSRVVATIFQLLTQETPRMKVRKTINATMFSLCHSTIVNSAKLLLFRNISIVVCNFNFQNIANV